MEAPRSLLGQVPQTFIGRDAELAELSAGVEDALRGRGRLYLITGEPGIGKTALAEHLAARARDRGMRVLWGHCWEGAGAPAYWPWVQALRPLIDEHTDPPSRRKPDVEHLAELLPDPLQTTDGAPVPQPAGARVRRVERSTGSAGARLTAGHGARRRRQPPKGGIHVQKITPFLWFDQQAEEAINFYVSVFNGAPRRNGGSKIISIARYEKGLEAPEVPGAPEMTGKVLTAVFELDGQRFMALDGGPIFKFTEAVSLYVECEDQREVDYFWSKLSAVPEAEQCGWLKDRYGLSWQIIPQQLGALLGDPNRKKALAAANVMLKMKKIVIADLEHAFRDA